MFWWLCNNKWENGILVEHKVPKVGCDSVLIENIMKIYSGVFVLLWSLTANLKTSEVKIVCLLSQRSSDISEPKTSQVNKCVSSIPKGSALQNSNSRGGHLRKNHSNHRYIRKCAFWILNHRRLYSDSLLFSFFERSALSHITFLQKHNCKKIKIYYQIIWGGLPRANFVSNAFSVLLIFDIKMNSLKCPILLINSVS